MNNHLKEILTALARGGVKFVVCGGVAVVLHGVERMTLDLDISMEMSGDNLAKLLKVMKKQGMIPRVPVPAEALLDPEMRRSMIEEKNALVFTFIDPDNPYRQLDLFLGDEHAYDALSRDSEKVLLEGMEIPVISIDRLIEMKRRIDPPREKDISDILHLERRKDRP